MDRLKIINVGNGSKEYPGNFTKKEIKIIKKYIIGYSLHLFSGRSLIGNIRVDFSCKEANYNWDVFKFLEKNTKSYNTIIIDAPYNQKFADKYNKFNKIDEKQFIIFADTPKTTKLFNEIKRINPEIVILKSWNYYLLKGYKLLKGFVCYAGGYRKSTFLLIMKKINILDVNNV